MENQQYFDILADFYNMPLPNYAHLKQYDSSLNCIAPDAKLEII